MLSSTEIRAVGPLWVGEPGGFALVQSPTSRLQQLACSSSFLFVAVDDSLLPELINF